MNPLVLLGFACLLAGQAHAARRSAIEFSSSAYQQPHRRQLQDALIPGLAAAASPAPERGTSRSAGGSAGRGATSSGVLLSALAYGEAVVACREWQPDTIGFDWPSNPIEYTAAGKTVPPSADVKKLTDLICSDSEAAGDQIKAAVEKGGAGAQTAVFSLFAADCDNEEATSDAFDTIMDALSSGDPADMDKVGRWFSNFAQAADAVGIPVCLTLAVIDPDTGKATDERFFHVTGPAPASRRRSGTGTGAIGSGSNP